MHPIKQSQPYPYRQWWMAACSREIGREIFGRTILGQRIVMFRQTSGEVAALAGYCPHRAFPLEKGRLDGDRIVCGYHGFAYNHLGSCVHIPSQPEVPENSWLRRYPVVEQAGIVWIWTGPAEEADPALLPDFNHLGLTGGWCQDISPVVTAKGRYTLLIDNLLDLTHVTFIHVDTLPGGAAVAALPSTLHDTKASFLVERIGRGLPPNPLFRLLFPDHDGLIDQHFDSEYLGPCVIRTGGRLFAGGDGRPLGVINFIHGITPETEHSHHYFVITSRNFEIDNAEISRFMLHMGDRIQPQDIEAVEAIEEMLTLSPEPFEISCRADMGSLRVRRRLAAQIAAEAAREPA